MARHIMIDGKAVDCTPEQEAYYDAKDAKFVADTAARIKQYVRKIRNKKLVNSDITQLSDRPDNDTKKDWATYRQTLRDIPVTDAKGNPSVMSDLWQSEKKKNLGQGDDGLWPTPPKE